MLGHNSGTSNFKRLDEPFGLLLPPHWMTYVPAASVTLAAPETLIWE
jgi:hypothetical protein